MIRSYDLQIPAGGSVTLEVQAQIFDFTSSGSAFDVVTVLPDVMQGSVSLKLGQGFDAGKLVNRWIVTNPGTTAINGAAVLSTAGFRNFRISGDVNVLDGGKSRTLSNAAFSGRSAAGALASNYSRVQLWNPANSGVRLVVEAYSAWVQTAETVDVYYNTVQLANLYQYGQAKLSGGAVSKGMLCWDQTTAAPVTTNLLWSVPMAANTLQPTAPREPYIITPGNGLLFGSEVVNDAMTGMIEWYEEPNT